MYEEQGRKSATCLVENLHFSWSQCIGCRGSNFVVEETERNTTEYLVEILTWSVFFHNSVVSLVIAKPIGTSDNNHSGYGMA